MFQLDLSFIVIWNHVFVVSNIKMHLLILNLLLKSTCIRYLSRFFNSVVFNDFIVILLNHKINVI